MRLYVPKSKIKFCICTGPVITKKSGTCLVIFLTVLLFTVTFIPLQPTYPPSFPSRPKTVLIFNNKDLCASNMSVLQSNGSNTVMSGTENNEKSIVIVVLSARNHFMNRNLIRQTWGAIKSANNITILAVIFMLGNLDAPGSKTDHIKLEAERNQFGDIIMGDFVDTYRNLTRKTIMAYEWLASHCQEAQIVVKTDDDVMLNIFRLTEELGKWSQTELTSSNIWCAVHWNESVVKDPGSVFYASPVDFPQGVFPKHCAGVLYATPTRVIHRILNEISNTFSGRVCTHEDVFMTGIVPQKINLISKNETINLIDKNSAWLTYALQTEQGSDAEFLIKLLQQPVNKIESFDEFQKRFGKTIIYLLNHKDVFKTRFERLWQIIQKLQN